MKVAIVGGHLSPALAVIDTLPQEDTCIFLGRQFALEGDKTPSLEFKEITQRGIPFFPLKTARIQRSFTRHTVPSLAKLPIGLYQAVTYLRQEKPDVVLSFGGYLSVPVGYAAKFLGIPLVIHEQTLEVGLANKLLQNVATKICISWEVSKKFFPRNKTVLTGNPLKKFTIPKLTEKDESKLPLLYVTGGSTGSHAINSLIEKVVPQLVKHYRVIHQTGNAQEFRDYERLISLRETFSLEEKERYRVEKFIVSDEVGSIFSQAALVISRSGINTVTELLYFGKPAILIPLPHGQHQEQLKNAEYLQKVGLAEILLQYHATGDKLLQLIDSMLEKRSVYTAKAQEAKSLINLNAAEEIIKVLSYVAKKKSS